MKIQIEVEVPIPDNKERPAKVSLKERIEYAIGCIECSAPNKQKAIAFLQKAHNALVEKDRTSKDDQILIDMIKPVINEYGNYHLKGNE